MQLPQNSSISATDREVKRLEGLLTNNKDIDHWSSYVGRGAIRSYLPLDAVQGNKAFAQLVIVTKDIEARKRVQHDLENIFKESFYNLNTRIMPLEMGPPIGWPIQYRVSGENIETVRDIAYQLAEIISTEQSVGNINFDWIEPARAMYVNIDQNQAKLLGISSEDLSITLNRIVSGLTLLKYLIIFT
ncbi:MAG: efflux RND transporter permease subunit [Candidatus Rickettsia vulgarisii]